MLAFVHVWPPRPAVSRWLACASSACTVHNTGFWPHFSSPSSTTRPSTRIAPVWVLYTYVSHLQADCPGLAYLDGRKPVKQAVRSLDHVLMRAYL